jgi:predicted RecA/RadA family phage recombinase
MSTNQVHAEEKLVLTAPTGGVESGEGVIIGDLFVVAEGDAAAAAEFVGNTAGVWELPKTSAQAWAEGDKIYWDHANGVATGTQALGPMIGVATEAAANPSSTGKVKLLGGKLRWDKVESATAVSKATAGAVTLTAAELLGGIVVADCAGAGRTYTLPTAALLVAAIPGAKVGDVVRTKIVNGSDAAEDITVAAGTGGGFDTNQTAASRIIGQNNSKELLVRLTNVTASSEAYVAYL